MCRVCCYHTFCESGVYTAPYLFSLRNGHQGVGSSVGRGQYEVIGWRLGLYSVVYASYGYSDCVVLVLCHYRTLNMICSVACSSFLVCQVRSPGYKVWWLCCCLIRCSSCLVCFSPSCSCLI